jgi:hypothetical protein
MAAVVAYQAATPGQSANAGHANQFLGGHNSTILYQGALASSQTTGSAVYSDTYTHWLTQSITTGVAQTAIGYLLLQLSTVGGSPVLTRIPPLTVGLYADDGNGLPTGAALASTTVTGAYIYLAPFWSVIPLPVTGLMPGAKYHVVTAIAGASSAYYVWQRTTQTSGAAASPDGTTWTQQPYGLMYQVVDQTATGDIRAIYEDSGARWTSLTHNGDGTLASVAEYTAGQTPAGALQSVRTLTYTNGLLTGVN